MLLLKKKGCLTFDGYRTFPSSTKSCNHDNPEKLAENEEKCQQPAKNIKSRFPFPTIILS